MGGSRPTDKANKIGITDIKLLGQSGDNVDIGISHINEQGVEPTNEVLTSPSIINLEALTVSSVSPVSLSKYLIPIFLLYVTFWLVSTSVYVLPSTTFVSLYTVNK